MRKRTPDGHEDYCIHCGAAIIYDETTWEWDSPKNMSAVCEDTGWWHEPRLHIRINGEYYFKYNFKDYINALS